MAEFTTVDVAEAVEVAERVKFVGIVDVASAMVDVAAVDVESAVRLVNES